MRELTGEPMNPGPILIIRNTFLTLLFALLFSALNYSENIKHIYFLAFTYKTQKHLYRVILVHVSLVYLARIIFILLHLLFILLHIHIYFPYIHTLCLTTTQWGWRHKTRKLFVGCLTRTKRAFSTVLREFDINPEFPRGKKLLLLQHSALGVPTKWHIA
jgi:hypothetical protein